MLIIIKKKITVGLSYIYKFQKNKPPPQNNETNDSIKLVKYFPVREELLDWRLI